jgi:hypothetical protein
MGGIMAFLAGLMFVWLAILVVYIAAGWTIFTKAKKPGWAVLVPIYNVIVLLDVVGRPLWWIVLLLFIPFVNVIFLIIVLVDLAKSFGKGVGYAMGLFFLPIIFLPMLAWGSAAYKGPAAKS